MNNSADNMKNRSTQLILTLLSAVLAYISPLHAAEHEILDCVIEPGMVIELSSRVDGILETMLVERGDRVEADTVIARLESGAESASVEYAQARATMEAEIRSHAVSLAYGWRNLKRINELHKKELVSSDEIDRVKTETRIAKHKLQQAKENKRLAELELARAEETLKRHVIRSPIDGVIAERYVSPGESVEDRPIVKIAQIDPLRVEVVVPVSMFGTIKTGQKAIVRPEAAIGGRYESTVHIVDPIINAASGTYRVTLLLPNPEHKLTSGLRCEVSFLDKPAAPSATAGKGPSNQKDKRNLSYVRKGKS